MPKELAWIVVGLIAAVLAGALIAGVFANWSHAL
jgi:uncharacterized membrane protein